MKTLIDIKIRQSQIHQEHLTISVASYSIYLLYDMDFNIYIQLPGCGSASCIPTVGEQWEAGGEVTNASWRPNARE
jgi:hypothetical protein